MAPKKRKTTRKKTTGTTRKYKRRYTRGLSGMTGLGDIGLNQVFSRSMYTLGGAISTEFAHSIVAKFLQNLGGNWSNNTIVTRAATLLLAYLLAGYMQKENGQDFLLGAIVANVNALLQEQGIYSFGQTTPSPAGTRGLNQLQQNQMRQLSANKGVGYNLFDEYLTGLSAGINDENQELMDVLNGLGQDNSDVITDLLLSSGTKGIGQDDVDILEEIEGLSQQDNSDVITDLLLSNTKGLGQEQDTEEVEDFVSDNISALSADDKEIQEFMSN